MASHRRPVPVPQRQAISNEGLSTHEISIISHTHGRNRRAERNIRKEELQAAIKYGERYRANPGPSGRPRWRFEYDGIVFITDETCRQEITSWKIRDQTPYHAPGAAYEGLVKSHVVLVVDHSGSMREADVLSSDHSVYQTRISSVYECLVRDFIDPQLKQIMKKLLKEQDKKKKSKSESVSVSMADPDQVVVSFIRLGTEANLLFERSPLNEDLLSWMQRRQMQGKAYKHGNYLPSLRLLEQVLRADEGQENHVLVFFLSDGAPSDSSNRLAVEIGCVEIVTGLGDRIGLDRFHLHTVAFGPSSVDYRVLESMAEVVPQGSFQKLGLGACNLSSAFSSLSATLTTLRTGLDGSQLTVVEGASEEFRDRMSSTDAIDTDYISADVWPMYIETAIVMRQEFGIGQVLSKKRFSAEKNIFVKDFFTAGANGLAFRNQWFSKGSERTVHYCSEIYSKENGQLGLDGKMKGVFMVAKMPLHEEDRRERFHSAMGKAQGKAQKTAEAFNKRISGIAEWQINFLPCWLYEIMHVDGQVETVWTEPFLDGLYTKYNNNIGGLGKQRKWKREPNLSGPRDIGVILEEEGEGEEEGETPIDWSSVDVLDIPQCFSHFSWSYSNGSHLICDLQGVWNQIDGFTLTDPVVHDGKERHQSRRTDKGSSGIHAFFRTHKCSPLCKRLGLKEYDGKWIKELD